MLRRGWDTQEGIVRKVLMGIALVLVAPLLGMSDLLAARGR
jgi:hypothetical protein